MKDANIATSDSLKVGTKQRRIIYSLNGIKMIQNGVS